MTSCIFIFQPNLYNDILSDINVYDYTPATGLVNHWSLFYYCQLSSYFTSNLTGWLWIMISVTEKSKGSAPEIVVPDLWGSKCEILDIGVVEGVAAALSELLPEEHFHVKTWTNKGVQYSTASRRRVCGTSLPTHRGFPRDTSDCCYLAQQAADHRLVWMWYTIWFIQSLWLFSASPTANGIIELVTRWTCGITLAHLRNDPSRQKCRLDSWCWSLSFCVRLEGFSPGTPTLSSGPKMCTLV